MSDIVLRTHAVSRSFGGVHAVREVSFEVAAGERRLVLGPNGAGKSVFFSLLGGQTRPTSGRVELHGEDVTALPPYRRARRGLARTFQLNSLFPDLTVRQNLAIAVQAAEGVRWSVLGAGARVRSRTDELLDRWRLGVHAEHTTALLSYGERRRLEVVLALAGRPTVLLLDEPTAGLTAEESQQMLAVILDMPRDVAIVMIEHDMSVADLFAERITVLAMGRKIADGDPEEIRQNTEVRDSYLGAR
jgi:branched-chain amino acid transport system ATP-binding protein